MRRENCIEQTLLDYTDRKSAVQGSGWGFGFGGVILVDPMQTKIPQFKGAIQCSGVYGRNWFHDLVNKNSA